MLAAVCFPWLSSHEALIMCLLLHNRLFVNHQTWILTVQATDDSDSEPSQPPSRFSGLGINDPAGLWSALPNYSFFFLFPLNLLLDYALLPFWNIDHHAWDIVVTHEKLWCYIMLAAIKSWVSECTVERQNSFLMSVRSKKCLSLFPMLLKFNLLILNISSSQCRWGHHATGFSSTIKWFVLCQEWWRALKKLKQMQSSNLLSLQRHGSQLKVCRLAFYHDYRCRTFHLSRLCIIHVRVYQ